MCYEQSGVIDFKILLYFVFDTLIYFSPKEFVMDNKRGNLISLSDQSLLLLVDVDCQRCLYLSLT